jgi:hypothetical protein
MAISYPTSLDSFTNPTNTSLLTSPSHAQQHADINDAVEALEAKVAIGNTVMGKYTSYTPTFPSGLTLGDGVATGGFCRVNDFVHYWGRVVWGTTTSLDTSGLEVSLPITCDATYSSTQSTISGYVGCRDVDAGVTYIGFARNIEGSPNDASLSVQNIVNTYLANAEITNTVPMTWVSTDIIVWNMYYKAA